MQTAITYKFWSVNYNLLPNYALYIADIGQVLKVIMPNKFEKYANLALVFYISDYRGSNVFKSFEIDLCNKR